MTIKCDNVTAKYVQPLIQQQYSLSGYIYLNRPLNENETKILKRALKKQLIKIRYDSYKWYIYIIVFY